MTVAMLLQNTVSSYLQTTGNWEIIFVSNPALKGLGLQE
jgi:hypothetical protein